jgi:acyl carrier protein
MPHASNEIKIWITDWFIDNSNIKEEEIKKNLSLNYFENGWIDSFKFIKFIADIEEYFGITFSNDEFQDRDFATAAGLAKIIKLRINEK